jgi:hypothetical protein
VTDGEGNVGLRTVVVLRQMHLMPAAAVLASLYAATCASARDSVVRLAQNAPDPSLAAPLEELCKLRDTLTNFQATIEATQRQIVTQRDDAAARYSEAEAALKTCLARLECKAADGERLATSVETLFEQRYAYDRMLTALDARLKEQTETGKRLDSLIQGRCS